ncbi:MAG: hypothetical protein BGN91_06300 [Nitrobacter sp. 62-13]|nr:MAG: hypothetical protein BGN91_06300 [Nitrobacter sp. 62-13]
MQQLLPDRLIDRKTIFASPTQTAQTIEVSFAGPDCSGGMFFRILQHSKIDVIEPCTIAAPDIGMHA